MALNRGCAYRSQVGPESAGQSLLAHLVASHAHSDASAWAARLARGEVVLDAVPASGAEVLRAGQVCVWQRPPWDEPDVPLSFRVVHEDEALLVVDKPSGLPTLPAGGFLDHTLLALVRTHDPDASPVHRLGRFTSGLVLCARTPAAARALSRAWRTHCVRKCYLAIGAGRPLWATTEIHARVGPVPHPRLGNVHAAAPDGKTAHSVASVLAPRGHDTLFNVRITTGRPHQVRIHLAWAGHPLVGDPLYGPGGVPRPGSTALPGDGGYWLHAHRLALAHPITGATVVFEAPPPAALAADGTDRPSPGPRRPPEARSEA
jgi:23S rRNA pseudouridine1911/1915/1917 synthase